MIRSKEMQALVVERANGPFVMTRLPSPAVGAHQALVRVLASGVNPLDTKIRAGNAAHARVAFPAVLGLDLAGVVQEVGYQVTGFREGDEVYAMGGGVGGLQVHWLRISLSTWTCWH
jgi:NADPH:quinone reductase